MKKYLFLLFSILSVSACFAQQGSLKQSGIFYRVNDTTAYQAAAATAHSQGYCDIYFNNQASTPHFDIWNGSSYTHVFDFNAGGSGSTSTNNRLPPNVKTASFTLSPADTSSMIVLNDTGDPLVITLDDFSGAPSGMQFSFLRYQADTVYFAAGGETLVNPSGTLGIPLNGFAYLYYDGDANKFTLLNGPSSSGGSTPTLQQVLTAGSALTSTANVTSTAAVNVSSEVSLHFGAGPGVDNGSFNIDATTGDLDFTSSIGGINFTSDEELSINGSAGTSGQVLTSAGAGLPPTWEDVGGGSGVIPWTAATGTNTYSATGVPASDIIFIQFANTNTGASSLAVNGGSAVDIHYWDGDSFEVTPSGYIKTGIVYRLDLVGSVWQLQSVGLIEGQAVEQVIGTASRIDVGGSAIIPQVDISSAYVGQTSITTLGTISTGTVPGTLVSNTPAGNIAATTVQGAVNELDGEKQATGLGWLLGSGGTLTGVNTITGTTTNIIKPVFDNLGTTQTNGAGMWFANTAAAGAGAQQRSPSIVLEGNGWKTDATAASQSVKFSMDVLPVQGTAAPTGTLLFRSSINNGAYGNNLLSIGSNGNTILTTTTSGTAFTCTTGTNSYFRANESGSIFLGNTSSSRIGSATSGGSTFSVAGASLCYQSDATHFFTTMSATSITSASGIKYNFQGTIDASGGSNTGTFIKLVPTYNITASTAAKVYDFFVEPIETALANTTHYGVVNSSPTALNGVATLTPNSTFHTNGSFAAGYVAKTANYTLTSSDHLVNCTANSFTITLPTAIGITGREYIIKNTGTATTISIATTSSQTIDGAAAATFTVTTMTPLRVISDGANWITY